MSYVDRINSLFALRCARGHRSRRRLPGCVALFLLVAEGICFAQQPLCVPGTQLCSRANGDGGVQAGGNVRGRVGANGATVDANANANGNVNTNGNVTGGGSASGGGDGSDYGGGDGNWHRSYSEPIRWGAGLLLCGTVKAGVYSGIKAGPCFAVSFRTERLTFEMESQLLFGGVRHSVDWVFPMSFVIPLTTQRSLYEGLQLRVGGSPIGVAFARAPDGGNSLTQPLPGG